MSTRFSIKCFGRLSHAGMPAGRAFVGKAVKTVGGSTVGRCVAATNHGSRVDFRAGECFYQLTMVIRGGRPVYSPNGYFSHLYIRLNDGTETDVDAARFDRAADCFVLGWGRRYMQFTAPPLNE